MSPAELFAQYQPLAQQIARGFARKLPCSVLIEDVEAAALLGLWHAASRGTPHEAFEYYARTCIRGAIQDELRRQDWLPRRARQRHPELRVSRLEDFENLDRVSALSVPPDAEQAIEQKERAQVLTDRLALLPAREAFILAEVFEGRTHGQIAASMGLSEPRISQLRTRAEHRLLGTCPPVKIRYRPARPSPIAPPNPIPNPRSLWDALVSGELRYVDHLALEATLVLRARRPRKPRPLPPQQAQVLEHWLLCGRPLMTSTHFGISRSHVMGLVAAGLKSMGFRGTPARVPLVLAVAARSAKLGIDPAALPSEDGYWQASIIRQEAWLEPLSVAEKRCGARAPERRDASGALRSPGHRLPHDCQPVEEWVPEARGVDHKRAPGARVAGPRRGDAFRASLF